MSFCLVEGRKGNPWRLLVVPKIIEENTEENNTEENMEDKLRRIMAEYARTDNKISQKASNFLDEIVSYKNAKAVRATHDLHGRILENLNERIIEFMDSIHRSNQDDASDIVSRIESYLSEAIPTWDNLEKAYKLCTSRGMNDTATERMLAIQPDDTKIRARLAGVLETFAASIKS